MKGPPPDELAAIAVALHVRGAGVVQGVQTPSAWLAEARALAVSGSAGVDDLKDARSW
jgi:hypothetical protein